MAVALEAILKQRVIVENRGGAGGGIGNAFVARSKPDGYTLLMALSSITILPAADRVNGRTPSYLRAGAGGATRQGRQTARAGHLG
jgi:tripartite-type tricarboxylate transporter receptor subunit TctC